MALLAVLSTASILMIPADSIDNHVARGLEKGEAESEKISIFAALAANRPLMLFAVLAALFHLANAAMLTSVGQLLTKVTGKENATSLIALCIVAAQRVMVPAR